MQLDRIQQLLAKPKTREEGIERLAESAVRTAAAIACRYLADSDPFVRMAALECVGERGNRRHSALVVPCLRDSEEIVRISAVECLVRWRLRSCERNIRKLLSDPEPLVRAYAGWALGELHAQAALRALHRALERESSGLARAGMLEAIVRMEHGELELDELLSLLGDRSHQTRVFVSNSLVGVSTPDTERKIRAALQNALKIEQKKGVRQVLRKNLSAL